MSIAALTLLMIAAQDKPMATFTQRDTNFAFEHPKEWVIKRTRVGTQFEMSLPDSDQKATLLVIGLENSNDKDEWQIGQANFVKNERREMVRQWQEEIMNVPLLMTRSKEQKEGLPETTRDSGMIYADSAIKFVFHLNAPSSVFDVADYQWRQVLQTLRPTNGLPQVPFDKSRPPRITEIRGGSSKSTTWSKPQKEAPKRPVIAEMSVAAKAAGKDYTLRYPKGWTVAPEGDHFSFKHSDVRGPVEVSVLSSVDSPPVGRALFQASADGLDEFTKVEKRVEAPFDYTRAGMSSTFIYRIGTGPKGVVSTVEGAGSLGNEYWLLVWVGDDKSSRSVDRLRDLMQVLRIEAAP